jgi:HEAT repeat protein
MERNKVKRIILFISFIAMLAASAGAQVVSNDFLQKGTAKAGSQEDELYKEATGLMDQRNWSEAAQRFDQVAKLKGSRADGALYWKAVALHRDGQDEESLRSLAELVKVSPRSRWMNDARTLEVEIHGTPNITGAVAEGPGSAEDCDLKLLALNRLMEQDSKRAIPLIEKFIAGPCGGKYAKRSVFVLAQTDDPQAREILVKIARGELHPELQREAIQQLGVVNPSKENYDALEQIYTSTNDVKIKKTILNAFGVSGEKKRLLAAARGEKDPVLQKEAIRGLGVGGATQELRQLYKDLTTEEGKMAVLEAYIIDGDSEAFEEVARTETNPRLQRKAIQGIGISGGKGAGASLVTIYQKTGDREIKRAAIEALFINGNAKPMVELARAEKDPEMKRNIVEKLGLMGGKDANDYLIEILEK